MNCDRIARWYRWLEYGAFGKQLEQRRFCFLADVAQARRVLVLGDGDGRYLAKLAAQNPDAAIDSIEASARMLALAQARTGAAVRHRRADARTVPLADAEYDLVATHFFLDCFNAADSRAVVGKIARATRPGGRWVISEFRRPAWWAGAALRGLYLFFRVATGLKTRRLVDHRPLLEAHGFRLERQVLRWHGLLASELWRRAPL